MGLGGTKPLRAVALCVVVASTGCSLIDLSALKASRIAAGSGGTAAGGDSASEGGTGGAAGGAGVAASGTHGGGGAEASAGSMSAADAGAIGGMGGEGGGASGAGGRGGARNGGAGSSSGGASGSGGSSEGGAGNGGGGAGSGGGGAGSGGGGASSGGGGEGGGGSGGDGGASAGTSGSGGAGGSPPSAFEESGGLLVIEAENYDDVVPGTFDVWLLVTAATASGGEAMFADDDDGTLYDYPGFSTNAPRLDYRVRFTTTGTYYVWVRNAATNSDGDSVHVGIDQAEIASSARITGTSGPSGYDYQWDNTEVTTLTVRTLVVSAAGDAVLNVWMREDGTYFDKILLTTDSAYTPTTTGPAESTRSP